MPLSVDSTLGGGPGDGGGDRDRALELRDVCQRESVAL